MVYKKAIPPDIPPVKGRQKRNNTKPTKKIKKFFAKTLENASTLDPDKAIRKAVDEVYTPRATTEAITSQTGLQILVKKFEEHGLNPDNDAKRMAEGVYSDDKAMAVRYEGLYYRLKYPEAFRNNVNIDNRSVQVSSITDQELDERIKLLQESLKD